MLRLRTSVSVLACLALAVSGAYLGAEATTTLVSAGPSTTVVEASGDTFTRVDAPGTNFGGRERLSVDSRSTVKRRSYLRFELPTPEPGTTLAGVTLSVYVTRRGAADAAPVVRRTNDSWSETELVWDNQPEAGARVARTPLDRHGRWLRWDVTDGLSARERSAGGAVSFVLMTRERARHVLKSRESPHAPRLALTTAVVEPGEELPTEPSTEAAVIRGWGPVVAGDEFDYTGAPDPTRWGVYSSVGHAGNGLRSPAAWLVADGVATVSGDEHGTTGGMSARFDRRMYGGWEVRMRTNARDPEYHPVLILWPDDGRGDTCPEIDFAEGSRDTGMMSFYLHYGCDSVQTWARRAVDTTEWHNYAVKWTPSRIVGYIDGVEWFRDTDPAHQPPGPMHQTIQLDWFPDGTATTPSWMQVDWVRVYDVPPVG